MVNTLEPSLFALTTFTQVILRNLPECQTIPAMWGKVKSLNFGFIMGFGYKQIDFSLSPALKFLPANTQPPIPWHRVIGATGTISSRGPGTDGARRQRDALVAEGVDVIEGLTGAFKVDLGRFGWFPRMQLVDEEEDDETEG